MKDEKGNPMTYWGGKQDDVEKLAEEVYGKGVVPDYEEGFTDGYNKAKETMYTQEDLCEAFHAHNDTWIDYEEWFKQFKKISYENSNAISNRTL